MAKLSDLTSIAARIFANCALNSGAAVIGSTASAFTTSAAIAYAIDGVIRSLAAQTNTALAALTAADLPASGAAYLQPSGAAGFVVQPANTVCHYVLCVNAAGAVRVVQGTWAGQVLSGGQNNATGNGHIPDIPDGVAPFAVLRVASGGSAFTPGTTVLTGIGTFANVMVLPSANTL